MKLGRKWPKPVKATAATTTVIPTTQSERPQQQLQRKKSRNEQKKKNMGSFIDSLLGLSLIGELGGDEVLPPKKEEQHKKRNPEPTFAMEQIVTSHNQYTVKTDKGRSCRQRGHKFHCSKSSPLNCSSSGERDISVLCF